MGRTWILQKNKSVTHTVRPSHHRPSVTRNASIEIFKRSVWIMYTHTRNFIQTSQIHENRINSLILSINRLVVSSRTKQTHKSVIQKDLANTWLKQRDSNTRMLTITWRSKQPSPLFGDMFVPKQSSDMFFSGFNFCYYVHFSFFSGLSTTFHLDYNF